MNSDERERRIPDIILEQYLLGELPVSEMVETKRVLDKDQETRARLQALERSNQEILEQYDPGLMSREIRLRLEQQKGRPAWKVLFLQPRPVTALLGAAVALALLLLVLPPDLISWRPGSDTATERIKGEGPQLNLYLKTQDGSEALEDGTRVFQGDVVRIGYQAAGRAYGAIVAVDGRGTVTAHLPNQGDRSVQLERDGQVLLDFALELDDAPHWERFYFVTSDAPFDVTAVLKAARQVDIERPTDQAEMLDLPEELDQFVISLEKGTQQ